MVLTGNHIDPLYSNLTLRFKTVLVQLASTVLNKFNITRRNFKSGIIRRLHSDYTKIYLMTEGLKSRIEDLNPEQYMAAYSSLNLSFKKFRTLEYYMRKSRYAGHAPLKATIEATLDNFYELEFELRKKAFANVASDPQDEEFKAIATTLSLNSVRSYYASTVPTA